MSGPYEPHLASDEPPALPRGSRTPSNRTRSGRRTSQQHVNTARTRLNSSFFPPNAELSEASEVEAARAAAMDLIEALADLAPGDSARKHVTEALHATIQVLAAHAGAATEWHPTGWWYEAKLKTAAAYEALGRPQTDPQR